MARRIWMPQVWFVPDTYRSDLKGTAISIVQPPSKRPVRTSHTGFQSEFELPSGFRQIDPSADRVRVKHVTIPAIMKGVEHEAKMIVLSNLVRVATHLV